MNWWLVLLGVIVTFTFAMAWAACAVASDADDELERRNDAGRLHED